MFVPYRLQRPSFKSATIVATRRALFLASWLALFGLAWTDDRASAAVLADANRSQPAFAGGVWVDKGCGATYRVGESMRIVVELRSKTPAHVIDFALHEAAGWSWRAVFGPSSARSYVWRQGKQPAQRTAFSLDHSPGAPEGRHELLLSSRGKTLGSCAFTVVPQTTEPPAPSRRITLLSAQPGPNSAAPLSCIWPNAMTGRASPTLWASVHNPTQQARNATMLLLVKGRRSGWSFEGIATDPLLPGGLATRSFQAKDLPIGTYVYQLQVFEGGRLVGQRFGHVTIDCCWC